MYELRQRKSPQRLTLRERERGSSFGKVVLTQFLNSKQSYILLIRKAKRKSRSLNGALQQESGLGCTIFNVVVGSIDEPLKRWCGSTSLTTGPLPLNEFPRIFMCNFFLALCAFSVSKIQIHNKTNGRKITLAVR